MRLKTGIWVAAYLRRCQIEGAAAVLRRRGAEEAGAIFIKVSRLDGTADLADASFRASIVFVTSVSADMASPNRGEYCVSKAGLSMAAKLFAVRLASGGIPVYEVRPGIISTDMTAGVQAAYDQRIADGLVPERRWGTPDDVGSAVAALVRGALPYATGSVINLDGGLGIARL